MFRSKRHGGLFLLCCIPVLLAFLALLFSDGFFADYAEEKYILSEEELFSSPKDFLREENTLTSTSSDPWLEIKIPNGHYTSIRFKVASLSKESVVCQVFSRFSLLEQYREEYAGTIELTEGESELLLPYKWIDRVRIDLTDEEGVSITLDEISLTRRIGEPAAWTILLFSVGAVVWLMAAFYFTGRLDDRFPVVARAVRNICSRRPKAVLATMVSLTLLVCFWDYLTGARYFAFLDIGSDTVFAYQPYYFSIADDIAKGRISAWTLNYGLGTSTLTHLAICADPFLWPTLFSYLMWGFRAAEVSIAWMHVLKLLICALLCYDLLDEYQVNKAANILTSYLYGFCGFVVLWGQHYQFATCFLIFSLIILLLERALKQHAAARQHAALAVAVAWMLCRSYYFGYMSLIMGAAYALVRLISLWPTRTAKQSVSSGALALLSVMLGVLASGALFLPQVREILTVSDRIKQSISLSASVKIVSPEQIRTILCRYLSNNLEGIKVYTGFANYYEAEQLFFSSFFIFFAVLYVLLGRHKSKKIFALRLFAVIILFAAPFSYITGIIFNGFVAPFGRYTFVFMPCFALITARSIEGIGKKEMTTADVLIAATAFLLLLLIPRIEKGIIKILFLSILAEFVILVSCTFAMTKAGRPSAFLKGMLVAVIVLNVCCETWLTTNHRNSLSDDYSDIQIFEMTQSVKAIRERLYEMSPGLYRIEKNYSDYSWFNDAMVEDYFGVSAYNSVVNSGIKAFYENCWHELIFGNNAAYIQFERNEEDAEKAALLGVRYLIAETMSDEIPGYGFVLPVQGKYLYENEYFEGFGRFFIDTVSYEVFSRMQDTEKQRALRESLILDETVQAPASTAEVAFDFPEKEDHLVGSVTCDGNGFVFLPIPFESGWTAEVNGKQVTLRRADYGFMALPVEAGTSSITLDFRIPLLSQGILLSVVGTVGIAWMMISARKRKKEVEGDHDQF